MALRIKRDGTYAALPQPKLARPKERITFAKEPRSFTPKQRRQIAGHARGRCEGCGTTLETGWHGHHTVPYSLGGKTDILNAEALCAGCHKDRHRPEEREQETAGRPEAPAPEPVEPEAGGPVRTTIG